MVKMLTATIITAIMIRVGIPWYLAFAGWFIVSAALGGDEAKREEK